LTLVEVCCIVVLVAVIVAVVIPGLLPSNRRPVERSAATSLKTLSTAEADFRANDRDWNHLNDYWTGDVKGLYTMTSAAVRGGAANTTTDPAIKLIELSLAAADADETFVPAGDENAPLSMFAVSSAKAGYWFAALDADLSVGPGAFYRQNTGGDIPMGKCHHDSRFGFVAFPDSPSAGKYVFIVNQKNTIYRTVVTKSLRSGTANPPGLGGVAEYLNWPVEAELQKRWSKLD